MKRAIRILSQHRAEQIARAEIDRYEWKNIYRAMRCLRGRAMNWLRKAARTPRDQVSTEFWIARQLLMAKYAEPDTDWEQPWMSVEDWRPDNRSCLRLFTLVVPRNFPRPIPCDVIRWALGALAMYITSEKCNADRPVSNTWNQYGHIAQAIPNWEWHVARLIEDSLAAATREYWPEGYAKLERRDRQNVLRHRLEQNDVRWRFRARRRRS